jgi:methylmalonyl-CoA/ethylmalonyl-CoA epimerase
MPAGPFAHVCLLVHDLEQATQDWTKILRVLDPEQLEQRIVRYDEFEGGDDQMRWVTFVSSSGSEIQLVEPHPDTPLGERLAKNGEGVHHICFTTDDPESALRQLADEGLSVSDEVYGDPSTPWQRWGWVFPNSAHGTLVEVARPYRAVEGRWESASDD